MDDPTDQELVARANRGDHAAFELLYRRYRDWVVAAAERVTGNRDDALDILQEVFGELFTRFPGFQLTAQMKTFLYPAVRHRALDRLRRRHPTVDIDELADVLPAPAGAEPATDAHRLLATLPLAQREVLSLRYADDLSLAQIAAVLGIPLGTVKSRLHHALLALRAALGS